MSKAELDHTREFLAMLARTRLSFDALSDEWWVIYIKQQKLYVLEEDDMKVVRKVPLSRKNVSAAIGLSAYGLSA